MRGILELRKKGLRAAEEVRANHLPSAGLGPLELAAEEEDEIVHAGKYGVGLGHYRMELPAIYPAHAVSVSSAALNAKLARQVPRCHGRRTFQLF